VVYWLASSAVDRLVRVPGRVKQKTITLLFVVSPLSTQHCVARNENNVCELIDMSTRRLLLQCASTMQSN
jgi:hypothetical protein